ncbi:Metabotropic glutamate receptor 2 [Chytriomyces hyalinus]|nr:Metabotropic glutamate receptor 2 [Chytriomyces hyalinus]
MNISIALIGNYCAMKYMTFNGSHASNFTSKMDTSIVNLNGNSGYTYLPDLAVMAAVDDINNDPSILPGVYVSLKRFSDCGPYYPKADAEYSGNSGGYASAVTATDIIENHKDVLGVIGNEFSNTARGLAQILSVEQIPYCAAVTGSPRFSDKNKYAYFWRMLPNSNGKYVAFILKYWNVKHVAIIYQADNEIGTSIHNRPKASADVRNYRFLKGLITVGSTASGNVSLQAKVYNKTVETAGSAFGRDYFDSYGLPGFYDCAYMMLLGFDKLIKSGATVERLSQLKFQSQMNISLWQSITGHSGLSMNPVLINERGDQEKPGIFSRFTGDYRNATTFAASDTHLMFMQSYNTSTRIFYNDSSISPPDSNVAELVLLSYSAESFYGQTIIALFGIGLLLSFSSYFLVIYERKNKIVRSTSIPECSILITGCLIGYAGSITYINAQSEALCKVRVWSLSLAQILIASPLISKSLFLVSMFASGRIYKNDRVLKRMQNQMRMLNGLAIAIEEVLLAFWTFENNSFVLEIKDNTSAYWRCSSFGSKNKPASPLSYALYSYNGLVILGLLMSASLEKSIHCKMQDNSATLITTLNFVFAFGLPSLWCLFALLDQQQLSFSVNLQKSKSGSPCCQLSKKVKPV